MLSLWTVLKPVAEEATMERKREPFYMSSLHPQCSLFLLPESSFCSNWAVQNFLPTTEYQHTVGLGECSGPASSGSYGCLGAALTQTPPLTGFLQAAVLLHWRKSCLPPLEVHGSRSLWDGSAEPHSVAKGKPFFCGLVRGADKTSKILIQQIFVSPPLWAWPIC